MIPTLGEEQSGKRKIRAGEDAPVLAVSALSDLITCITNLLTVGAGGPSFAYKACGFAEELLKTGKICLFLSLRERKCLQNCL